MVKREDTRQQCIMSPSPEKNERDLMFYYTPPFFRSVVCSLQTAPAIKNLFMKDDTFGFHPRLRSNQQLPTAVMYGIFTYTYHHLA